MLIPYSVHLPCFSESQSPTIWIFPDLHAFARAVPSALLLLTWQASRWRRAQPWEAMRSSRGLSLVLALSPSIHADQWPHLPEEGWEACPV